MSWKNRLQFGIKGRLYVLVGLFAISCAALAAALIWLQAERAFEARKQSLEQLVAAAQGVLAAHKALADSGQMPVEEARKRALKVIGAMWYGKADYFTARDTNGIALLNPAAPEKEGQNRDEATDSKGRHYSRQMTEMVRDPGEGFVTYNTINPDTKLDAEKTSYIKLYKPWGIAVAAGVFTDDLAVETHAAMLQAALITLFLVGVLGGVAIWQAHAIVRPLTRLQGAMLDLAEGRESSVALDTERHDEIGAMAKAVQVFKDNSVALKAAEAEQLRASDLAEEQRLRIDAERRQNEAEQTAMVGTLADNLVKIAKGDLTTRIEAEFKGRYQQIKTDFNAAVARLEETMQSVAGSTKAIQSGTQEMSSAADDLSRRTEQQAASLEETAAALEEITTTVKKSAEGATHARQVVTAADDDAKKSALVVRQAVEAMDAIAKSAQQISQIIGVIDEIAFQTNLLALNAGVEAARAGDAGRGFAVVASEVRALAQRSAEAAKEIKGLITASTRQVESGVKLVGETGASLERIMAQVTEINSIVGEITAGAREQATGIGEVNTAISQMDQMTQQNSAMVEESTAATHSLSQETAQLSNLIDQFQLGRADNNESMRRELQKVAPHAFRQPPKAAAPKGGAQAETRKSAAQPVHAAPKAKVANGAPVDVAGGGWKEF
jgi:methyl-accepting chemotaxis protein